MLIFSIFFASGGGELASKTDGVSWRQVWWSVSWCWAMVLWLLMCISILSIPTWTWMAIHVRFQSLGFKKNWAPTKNPRKPHNLPEKMVGIKVDLWYTWKVKSNLMLPLMIASWNTSRWKPEVFLLLPFFVGGSWFRSLVVKLWSEDGDRPFPISNRIASPVTWPKTPSSWGFGEVPNLNQPWFQVAEIYHI